MERLVKTVLRVDSIRGLEGYKQGMKTNIIYVIVLTVQGTMSLCKLVRQITVNIDNINTLHMHECRLRLTTLSYVLC